MWDIFNVPKIKNLYYMSTDQLQYIIKAHHAKYLILFSFFPFEDALTSKTLGG